MKLQRNAAVTRPVYRGYVGHAESGRGRDVMRLFCLTESFDINDPSAFGSVVFTSFKVEQVREVVEV
jgi:hypothetical protein